MKELIACWPSEALCALLFSSVISSSAINVVNLLNLFIERSIVSSVNFLKVDETSCDAHLFEAEFQIADCDLQRRFMTTRGFFRGANETFMTDIWPENCAQCFDSDLVEIGFHEAREFQFLIIRNLCPTAET